MTLQEELDEILKDTILECDGKNKECYRCLSNMGRDQDNRIVCFRKIKE